MRRALAWALIAPLAILGSQFAHVVAYRGVEPDASARAALLTSTGHSYLDYVPLAVALMTALGAFAAIGQFRLALQGSPTTRVRWAPFAGLPLIVFALQEHFERLVHDGSIPWTAATAPTFLLGLALQLPFALLAYGIARFVLRAVRSLAHAIAARRRARRLPATRTRRIPLTLGVPHATGLARGWTGRGPPLPA
jgi:hypothetical protein